MRHARRPDPPTTGAHEADPVVPAIAAPRRLRAGTLPSSAEPAATASAESDRARLEGRAGAQGTPLARVFTEREKAGLRWFRLRDADLGGADFIHADLRGARFVRCDLRGADLSGADLRGARFVRCDLRGVQLRAVRLGGTRFVDCRLAGARGLTLTQVLYLRTRAVRRRAARERVR